MTQDEIIRIAREAGLIQYVQVEKTCVSNALERFAALVAAHEREKCAKVCETDELCCKCGDECAAAIRAIKFEGDTGFRPVSEMIAEHKQDPKKAAAIEKAKMRKAEQKPVAVVEITYGREPECYVTGTIDDFPEGVFKLYAAPARTKDLTDDEIHDVFKSLGFSLADPRTEDFSVARAVIAADREKNK